jgi:hypothetical protein
MPRALLPCDDPARTSARGRVRRIGAGSTPCLPGTPIVRVATGAVQTQELPDVTNLHQILALAVVAATAGLLAAGAWSIVAGRRSDGRHDHRFAVDRMALVVEGLIAVNAVLGAVLVASALRPADILHLLYGPAAVVSLPVGWALGARRRADGPPTRLRRDAWLLGASLVLVGLEVRLFLTG